MKGLMELNKRLSISLGKAESRIIDLEGQVKIQNKQQMNELALVVHQSSPPPKLKMNEQRMDYFYQLEMTRNEVHEAMLELEHKSRLHKEQLELISAQHKQQLAALELSSKSTMNHQRIQFRTELAYNRYLFLASNLATWLRKRQERKYCIALFVWKNFKTRHETKHQISEYSNTSCILSSRYEAKMKVAKGCVLVTSNITKRKQSQWLQKLAFTKLSLLCQQSSERNRLLNMVIRVFKRLSISTSFRKWFIVIFREKASAASIGQSMSKWRLYLNSKRAEKYKNEMNNSRWRLLRVRLNSRKYTIFNMVRKLATYSKRLLLQQGFQMFVYHCQMMKRLNSLSGKSYHRYMNSAIQRWKWFSSASVAFYRFSLSLEKAIGFQKQEAIRIRFDQWLVFHRFRNIRDSQLRGLISKISRYHVTNCFQIWRDTNNSTAICGRLGRICVKSKLVQAMRHWRRISDREQKLDIIFKRQDRAITRIGLYQWKLATCCSSQLDSRMAMARNMKIRMIFNQWRNAAILEITRLQLGFELLAKLLNDQKILQLAFRRFKYLYHTKYGVIQSLVVACSKCCLRKCLRFWTRSIRIIDLSEISKQQLVVVHDIQEINRHSQHQALFRLSMYKLKCRAFGRWKYRMSQLIWKRGTKLEENCILIKCMALRLQSVLWFQSMKESFGQWSMKTLFSKWSDSRVMLTGVLCTSWSKMDILKQRRNAFFKLRDLSVHYSTNRQLKARLNTLCEVSEDVKRCYFKNEKQMESMKTTKVRNERMAGLRVIVLLMDKNHRACKKKVISLLFSICIMIPNNKNQMSPRVSRSPSPIRRLFSSTASSPVKLNREFSWAKEANSSSVKYKVDTASSPVKSGMKYESSFRMPNSSPVRISTSSSPVKFKMNSASSPVAHDYFNDEELVNNEEEEVIIPVGVLKDMYEELMETKTQLDLLKRDQYEFISTEIHSQDKSNVSLQRTLDKMAKSYATIKPKII